MTETFFYHLFIVLTGVFFLIYAASNLTFYNKIKKNASGCVVTQREAKTMASFSVLVLILSIITLLYGLFQMMSSGSHKVVTNLYRQTFRGRVPEGIALGKL